MRAGTPLLLYSNKKYRTMQAVLYGAIFLYNENPQFNWGFKKLKAMGRKK